MNDQSKVDIAWDLSGMYADVNSQKISETMNVLTSQCENIVNDYKGKMNSPDFSSQNLENTLRKLQEQEGWKPRPAFMSIRICLTGQLHTPPLFDVMVVLGKKLVIKRLSHAIKILK